MVASTIVSGRYSRCVRKPFGSLSRGRIWQNPPRSQSSSLPKQLAESTRGMQHQSMEPSRLTSAIEWQSLIRP